MGDHFRLGRDALGGIAQEFGGSAKSACRRLLSRLS
jgi:hypothetical protein